MTEDNRKRFSFRPRYSPDSSNREQIMTVLNAENETNIMLIYF